MKDLDKVLVPSSDIILIVLREGEPGDYISFALPINLPLNLSHSSVIDSTPVSGSLVVDIAGLVHVRSQISDRIEDGLGWFVQLYPTQSPVKYLAYITTIPPKFDVILVVGQGVLDSCQLVIRLR